MFKEISIILVGALIIGSVCNYYGLFQFGGDEITIYGESDLSGYLLNTTDFSGFANGTIPTYDFTDYANHSDVPSYDFSGYVNQTTIVFPDTSDYSNNTHTHYVENDTWAVVKTAYFSIAGAGALAGSLAHGLTWTPLAVFASFSDDNSTSLTSGMYIGTIKFNSTYIDYVGRISYAGSAGSFAKLSFLCLASLAPVFINVGED